VLTGLVVAVAILLGLFKTAQAVTGALGLPALGERALLLISAVATAAVAWPVYRAVRRRR
jgi:hypothetical protein